MTLNISNQCRAVINEAIRKLNYVARTVEYRSEVIGIKFYRAPVRLYLNVASILVAKKQERFQDLETAQRLVFNIDVLRYEDRLENFDLFSLEMKYLE
eukprot:g26025.t1